MQVSVEQLDPCKVELNIEVDAEKVARTIDNVYREFSRTTNVPGFRKGKTPRAILERYVPEESVRRRAVDLMVPPAYSEALKQADIHPYADPEVEIVQLDTAQPFKFKAMVPLPPKVELGEYKGIKAERHVAQVTDEQVEAQLKQLQDSRATGEKVEDRGVRKGDFVVAKMASAVEGEKKSESKRSLIHVGENVPGFDEGIAGLKIGEQRSFTVEYPADYSDEELAGKKVEFDVSVESIREHKLPELNDEFARSIGDFETLDALREDIRKHLIEAAEDAADKEVEQKIVDEILSRSDICFPDVLLEHEVYHDLEEIHNRFQRMQVSIRQYLEHAGKSEEDFLKELREVAARRIKLGLVLGEIAEKEKIDVTEEEVDAEIDSIAADSNTTREFVETYMEARGGRSSLKNSLFSRKIMDFLNSVSTIK